MMTYPSPNIEESHSKAHRPVAIDEIHEGYIDRKNSVQHPFIIDFPIKTYNGVNAVDLHSSLSNESCMKVKVTGAKGIATPQEKVIVCIVRKVIEARIPI